MNDINYYNNYQHICSSVLLTKFPLHVGIIVALHDYDASQPDELSFKESERLQRVNDIEYGWWRARSLVTGKEGVIPNNYVAPVQSIQKQEYVTVDVTYNLFICS